VFVGVSVDVGVSVGVDVLVGVEVSVGVGVGEQTSGKQGTIGVSVAVGVSVGGTEGAIGAYVVKCVTVTVSVRANVSTLPPTNCQLPLSTTQIPRLAGAAPFNSASV